MACILKRHIVHHVHISSLHPYRWYLRLQQNLAQKVAADPYINFLLTLEHKPVYTVGLRKDPSYSKELFDCLRSRGAEVCNIDRGGLITFHGPGQLVAYPILNLKAFYHIPGVRCYVDCLHNTLLSTCFCHGVIAALHPSYVGVFVGESGKIASLGVHCRRFVTMHGIALNCNTDLSWFDYIIPCGLTDKKATSLSVQLDRNVQVLEVLPSFLAAFSAVFNCELIRDSASLKNIVSSQFKS